MNNSVLRMYYTSDPNKWNEDYQYTYNVYMTYNSSTTETSDFVITFSLHAWAALQFKITSSNLYTRIYWGARGFTSWKQLI